MRVDRREQPARDPAVDDLHARIEPRLHAFRQDVLHVLRTVDDLVGPDLRAERAPPRQRHLRAHVGTDRFDGIIVGLERTGRAMPVLEQVVEHAAVQRKLRREVVMQVGFRQAGTLRDHRGTRAVEPAFREHGLRAREQMRFVGLADVRLASPQRRGRFVAVGGCGCRLVMSHRCPRAAGVPRWASF